LNSSVEKAFRLKARNDFVAGRAVANEQEYLAQLSHASEVAQFLRKNVIQGVLENGSDTWSAFLFSISHVTSVYA
jgi:hypothetical protein